MPSKEEVDALTQRVAELERELAELKAAHAKIMEAMVKADQTWGEFNPG